VNAGPGVPRQDSAVAVAAARGPGQNVFTVTGKASPVRHGHDDKSRLKSRSLLVSPGGVVTGTRLASPVASASSHF
jgi:hypothetical protein